MRWCLIDLPVISLAMLGLLSAASADGLDQVRLRGSSAYDAAPSYPVIVSEPSYRVPASPSYPAPYPNAATYPAKTRPSRPVAVAPQAAQLHNFTFEFGTRYWYSSGTLAKDLYDDPRFSNVLNSRLTYAGLATGTFEGFGRANTPFGSFLKGYVGLSGLDRGSLNDEDFPPNTTPYSSTLSQQQGGKLAYGSLDFGQIVVKNNRVSVGLFAGYGYLAERVNAYGCEQIAGNPSICVPAISAGVLGITEDTQWQFARLGLLGEFKMLDCLKLSAEVAWLPYEQVSAQDTHWLRLGSGFLDIAGPIPESGGGTGVQIETILSYQVNDRVTFGLGGRYWHLQTQGSTDFESVIVGLPYPPASQPLNFTAIRYGGFAQGAYRFGPL
jgi:hypothetical protein